MKLVTAQQMKKMDQMTIESFGIPGRVLMENAGRGAVDMMQQHYDHLADQSVCILAGRGNNGGDGFVIGRYLMELGIPTTMVLLSTTDRVTGDARANLDLVARLCQKNTCGRLVEVPDARTFDSHKSVMEAHDLFVDAILGTGLTSDVKGFFKQVIDWINQRHQPVFSVDIPSGLNADTGKPCGVAVMADATATFAFVKQGLVLFPGNRYTGELRVIDIGIPDFIARQQGPFLDLMEKADIAALFPPRNFDAHKGSFGHLMVLAGSKGKTGAAVLCANAAARMGTGLVTLAVPESLYSIFTGLAPEIMTAVIDDKGSGLFRESNLAALLKEADGKTAVAAGPGLGTHPDTRPLVTGLVESSEVPLLLDADALNCIAKTGPGILSAAACQPVITPHPGEMGRLTGQSAKAVQSDRLNTGEGFARTHQSVVVLKGSQTLVCSPQGPVRVCPTGNPGMASGGMGDVLSGMIAGLLAQGFAPEDAAAAGVYLHGHCGDLLAEETDDFGFLASDITARLPGILNR